MPDPGRGQIRIRVRACGVCHSDQLVTGGLWPGLQLPRVPGHEVAGVVDALGPGLGLEGCLLIVAAPFEPIQVGVIDLLSRDARIQGWSSGTASDSADAMAFALKHGVRPMIEKFPLQDASRALDAMSQGTVRFRAVLETAGA